jgi:type 2 lantibiotic biosynthesis protein LanM
MSGSSTDWWSAAATLAERVRDLHRADAPATTPHIDPPPNARGLRRLERWRTQRPFDKPELFARRLELDSLTEDKFAALLATAPHSDGAPPQWVSQIEHAHSRRDSSTAGEPSATRTDEAGVELAKAFAEPFVASSLERLFVRATQIRRENPHAPFDPERVVRLFEPALWAQVVTRSIKVAILELNVARVQGLLVGDTPEQRYASFTHQLRTSGLRRRILEEYPVLARLMVAAATDWESFAAEFLEHVTQDLSDLSATLAGGQPLGELHELKIGVGDAHQRGRSVIIVGFSSGERFAYKPRSLATDVRFAQLIDWINARGQSPALRAVRTIDRGSHGWAEFVPSVPCDTESDVERFYERLGANLAILHALEATDFHYENVIANGAHPMLIDLEALFHPRLKLGESHDEPEWIAWNALQHSVLRAGVLPFRAFSNDDSSGIDMSSVGGGREQRTPNRLPVMVGGGTDEMRLIRDFVTLPPAQNRPALGAAVIDPLRYGTQIMTGFTSTYRLLMEHRDALTAPNGPIRAFAAASVRVVLRPTRHYALILGESYHPDVLRDALDRDRLLDRLWVAVPSHRELERVIAYEHADLVNGDVPVFATNPGSRALITSNGDVLADYFDQCGLDSAIERIETLGEDDLQRQQWIIQASLVALEPGRHSAATAGDTLLVESPPNGHATFPARDACIDAALLVGRRLAKLALRSNARTSWLGLTLVRERDWVIQPVGMEPYSGSLGIAFFLAHLAAITGEQEPHQLAREVMTHAVLRLGELTRQPDVGSHVVPGSLGAFGSTGGAVYTLSHIGALWRDSVMVDLAHRLVGVATPEIERDKFLDVITGVAGLILSLRSLQRVQPRGATHAVVHACAERLLETAVAKNGGLGWSTELSSTQPLTGFSHGASGIGVALLEAASVLNDRRYQDAALSAFNYEHSTFSSALDNWPDFRILSGEPVSTQPPFMWAWCHGAPGIGLARLAALQYVDVPELAAELDVTLRSTLKAGFGGNDCLCHGDLGNIELLLRARELGFSGPWESHLAVIASRIVDRLTAGQWRCGIPGGVETPGLMMGLAGIGYGLLRLGATERVPSLLSLEPPRSVPARVPR